MARKDRKQKEKRPSMPVVIGAGITEQWYFTHLKKLKELQIQIRPRFFGDEHMHALAKNVEHVLASEGRAIVVFDTDVQAWDAGEKTRYEAFMKKYGKDERVIICDSLPSIEYWFLLHHLNTNRYFGTSKAVVKELLHYIPRQNVSSVPRNGWKICVQTERLSLQPQEHWLLAIKESRTPTYQGCCNHALLNLLPTRKTEHQ